VHLWRPFEDLRQLNWLQIKNQLNVLDMNIICSYLKLTIYYLTYLFCNRIIYHVSFKMNDNKYYKNSLNYKSRHN